MLQPTKTYCRSNYQASLQNGGVVCYINQASSCLPLAMGFRVATGTGTLSLPFIEPLILSLETWISTFSRPLGIISDVSYVAKMEWENMTVIPAHILQC